MYIPTRERGTPAAEGTEILAQSQCLHKQEAWNRNTLQGLTG